MLGGVIRVLQRRRLPGDALIILAGALPLVYLAFQASRYPKDVVEVSGPERVSPFTKAASL